MIIESGKVFDEINKHFEKYLALQENFKKNAKVEDNDNDVILFTGKIIAIEDSFLIISEAIKSVENSSVDKEI